MERRACPLCGCREHKAHPDAGFIVCNGCAETLLPSELARRASRRTRARYLKANPDAQL